MSDTKKNKESFFDELFEKVRNPFVTSLVIAALATYPKEFYSIFTHESNWTEAMNKIDLLTLEYTGHFILVLIFILVSPFFGKLLIYSKDHVIKRSDKFFNDLTLLTLDESNKLRQQNYSLENRVSTLQSEIHTHKVSKLTFKTSLLESLNVPVDGQITLTFDNSGNGRSDLIPYLYNPLNENNKHLENKSIFDTDNSNEEIRFRTYIKVRNNSSLHYEVTVKIIPNFNYELRKIGHSVLFRHFKDENDKDDWTNLYYSQEDPKRWVSKKSDKTKSFIWLQRQGDYVGCKIAMESK